MNRALSTLLNRFARPRPSPKPAVKPRYDPLDPAFVQDPYPLYRHLRDHDPVHLTASGALMLTRYADVVEALGHPLLGNAPATYSAVAPRNRDRHVCADLANNILPFLDSPAHDPLRRVIARSFHAHQKVDPLDLAGLAASHAARLKDHDQFEVLEDFATPFSLDVICRLLGLPGEDGARLKELGEYFFYLFSQIPSEEFRTEMNSRLAEFRTYAGDLIERRRAAPGRNYVSALIAEADAAGIGDDGLIRDAVILIFADAIENVDKTIATCLLLLLSHSEAEAEVRRRPAALPGAIEECLRFQSPAQVIARVAKADLEFAGVPVRKDQAVLLALGAANRDECRFANADTFDITRSDNPHLSFGKGRHSCIGGSLVQRQTQPGLEALLQLGELRLVDPKPRWLPRPGHRWLERLRVEVAAR